MSNKQREGVENKLLNISEAAEYMNISRRTVSRWVDDGCPTAIKSKSIVRLRPVDVMEWYNERENKKKGDMNIIDN